MNIKKAILMRTMMMILLGAIVMTGFTSGTFFSTKGGQCVLSFQGTIESIDVVAQILVVKDLQGVDRVFVVSADVRIVKQKKKVVLADLVAGDSIIVTYSGTLSSPTVRKINCP